MDGRKVYVPTGWWDKAEDGGMLVVDGQNGNLIKRIRVGPQAHNSFVSLDGRRVYLGTNTMLTVFDTVNENVIRQVKDVGEFGVFPYTVNSANTIAYVCLGKTVGFDIVDLRSGKILQRVTAGDEPIRHRTHGVGLTPDEAELWISDQEGKKLFIYDATKMPPQPKGHVELSIGGHGWVTFSLDGRYVYSHAPDIFDAKTKKLVGTFKDEQDRPFASSKFIEVHFRDGKVTQLGNEFGLGRK
jgi:DNA-binding beta-propeller fold protein YncE